MTALRCRRLLGALTVLVRHLGRGARPWGRLYAGNRKANRKSGGGQAFTAATTGRNEPIVLQELGLVLGDEQGEDVDRLSVRARRREVGERGRSWGRGAGGSRSRRAVAVGVNTDAMPGSAGVVRLIWFGGSWPAVHEYSAARLPRTARELERRKEREGRM